MSLFNIWKDEIVRNNLDWYYNVMKGYKPAKFLICKYIEANINLEDSNKRLWLEHDELSKLFDIYYERIKGGEKIELAVKHPNFLDLKAELANRMLKECNMCEWNYKVDRSKGKVGVCRLDYKTRVASYFKHFGEEAPLVNNQGSGTIFFTGCIFKCVFCQNWDISQYPLAGDEVDEYALADIMKHLYLEGAANINFVGGEPTPNLHTIIASMKHMPFSIPMIWNSDMYDSIDSIKLLMHIIDLWLPDFKYGNDECARRLSNIPRYLDIVARNHRLVYGNDMIIRHLVMPNHLECCTKPILRWIKDNMPDVLINIMDQYYPAYKVLRYPDKYKDIARRLTRKEIVEAYRYADSLGLLYKQVS
jgi:putative pyruvate formate lyase activating enzyme